MGQLEEERAIRMSQEFNIRITLDIFGRRGEWGWILVGCFGRI